MITFKINQLPGSFSYHLGLEVICLGVLYCAYFYGPLATLGSEIIYFSRECEFNKFHYKRPFLLPIFFPESNSSAQFSLATCLQLMGLWRVFLDLFFIGLSLLFGAVCIGGDTLPFWHCLCIASGVCAVAGERLVKGFPLPGPALPSVTALQLRALSCPLLPLRVNVPSSATCAGQGHEQCHRHTQPNILFRMLAQ